MSIPPELLERFRVTSLERVGRIESTWNRLVHARSDDDDRVVDLLLREVHTLKGDAAVSGSRDVQRLCQKIEDLLTVVQGPRFEVSDDVDMLVTMAIQFLGMLLRVRSGPLTGLDLDGFVRQVDDVLRESRTLPFAQRRLRRTTGDGAGTETALDRIAESTRRRLAIAATTVFLEYLSARRPVTRSRLRSAWTTLRDELARVETVELAPVFERHAAAARELALGIGKRIDIEIAIAGVRIEPRTADAVDIAVLHLVRNAIDHGIEAPAARVAAGKSEAGRVRITVAPRDANIEIVVADDGAGIDFTAVRHAAVDGGLLDPTHAADERALLELVYRPGLSTKSAVTELSGRGVGMDAARSAIARVGGQIRIATSARGTTVTVTVPALVRQLHAYQFLAPGGAVSLAVSARWSAGIEAIPDAGAIHPLDAFELFTDSRQTNVQPPGMPGVPKTLSIRLRWGFLEVSLLCGLHRAAPGHRGADLRDARRSSGGDRDDRRAGDAAATPRAGERARDAARGAERPVTQDGLAAVVPRARSATNRPTARIRTSRSSGLSRYSSAPIPSTACSVL